MVWKTQLHPQFADHYEVLLRNDDGKPIAGITREREGDPLLAIYMGAFLGEYPSIEAAKQAVENYQL